MRIELNLASRPTENRRRFLVLAGTGIALLLALAVYQGASYWRKWGSERETARRTLELQAEIRRLDAQQQKLEESLRRPEAVQVLETSYFLNGLILQKSFSWTRIFMDLEQLMPDDVQVATIHPIVKESGIQLDMTLVAKNSDQMAEFVRRLERSEKFGKPVLKQETPPAGGLENSARLSLTVDYVQK
jgi:type IV pilus assembly protein PilN